MNLANHSKMKLGRTKPATKSAHIALATFAAEPLPPAPPTFDGSELVMQGGGYPLFGNDKYGDCTCVATAHLMMTIAAAKADRSVGFTDEEVIGTYLQLGDGEDEGLVETDVLKAVSSVGFPIPDPTDHWLGHVSIDHHDVELVKQCIALFGGAYIGAELPVTAESQEVWDIIGNPNDRKSNAFPGSWGGHAMCVVGYDARGVWVITWGAKKLMTWEWFGLYVDEFHVCLDYQLSYRAGLDITALQRYMQIAGGLPVKVTAPSAEEIEAAQKAERDAAAAKVEEELLAAAAAGAAKAQQEADARTKQAEKDAEEAAAKAALVEAEHKAQATHEALAAAKAADKATDDALLAAEKAEIEASEVEIVAEPATPPGTDPTPAR